MVVLGFLRVLMRARLVQLFFAVCLTGVLGACLFAELSFDQQARVFRDVSIAAVSFTTVVQCFVSGSVLHGVRVGPWIAQGVLRSEVVWGRFLSLVSGAWATLLGTAVLQVTLYALRFGEPGLMLWQLGLVMMELVLVCATVALLGSLMAPTSSSVAASLMWIAGRTLFELEGVREGLKNPALSEVLRWISRLVPNFYLYTPDPLVVSDAELPGHSWEVFFYTLTYGLAAMLAASLCWARRDLE